MMKLGDTVHWIERVHCSRCGCRMHGDTCPGMKALGGGKSSPGKPLRPCDCDGYIAGGAEPGEVVRLYTDKGDKGRILRRTPTWCNVRWPDGSETCRVPIPLPEGWEVVQPSMSASRP